MNDPSNPIRSLPTPSLLGLVVGEVAAAAFAGRRLTDLFTLQPNSETGERGDAEYRATLILEAAKELVARALGEDLQHGDCLGSPEKMRDLLRLRYAGLPHEVFVVVLLDSQNRIIAECELFRGTLTQTSVYPREVVKLVLHANAAAVIFAHNHPSGSSEPSTADQQLTRTLREALALVDVRVLDHFIVAGSASPVSFAERGLL